jgi:signal transduction histidine kinase
MENRSSVSSGRDWMLFSVRWILLLLAALTILISRNQSGIPSNNQDIWTAAFIAGIANLLLLPLLLIRTLEPGLGIAAFIGDLVITAVFVNISRGDAWSVVSIVTGVMLCGLVRSSFVYSVAQVIGVMLVTVLTLAATLGTAGLNALSMPLTILGIVGIVILAAAYGLEQQVGKLRGQLDKVRRRQSEEIQAARERTRALYDLSFILSSTLNYEKILEAALEAGRLGLRLPEREGASLIAAVMLFHSEDNALHVVSSRRLTRADDSRVIPGKSGLVGEALKEAVPVFGTNAAKDPELQYFVAFQYCRSTLCIPLRAGFDNYGILVYGSEKPNAFTEDQSELLTAVGTQATIALQNALLYQNLRDEKEKIVEVEEDARKKLARDLHDGPTQSIAAIAMRMSYIARLYTKSPEQVPDELKKVEELARKTTKEIRHMLFTLRPLVLESQGMVAALNQLAEKMQDTHGQAVAVRVARDVDQYIDRNQQGVLFYIVEEAVNNARKHAQADLISVTVNKQDDVIIVQIADNGVGFNTNAVNTNYEQRGSLGMVNMRERAEVLEGSLSIDSEEGRGTIITVLIPLTSPNGALREASRPTKSMTKLALAASERVERLEASRNLPRL